MSIYRMPLNHTSRPDFIFKSIALCGAFLLCFALVCSVQANETPIFQSEMNSVDAYKFKPYFDVQSFQTPHFFKIDLNNDNIQEFIFVEGSCVTEKQRDCDYHILADTTPAPIALGVLKGRSIAISLEIHEGVRSIYLYSKLNNNDFKPDLYEWHSIDTQYKMTKNTDLGIIEK